MTNRYLFKKLFRKICFVVILGISLLLIKVSIKVVIESTENTQKETTLHKKADQDTMSQNEISVPNEVNQYTEVNEKREDKLIETNPESEHILGSEDVELQEGEKESTLTNVDFSEGVNMDVSKFLDYPAGTIIKPEGIAQEVLTQLFYSMELNDGLKERIQGKSYGEKCDVPYEDLRYIRVLYYGFDQETHLGEMIVNHQIAEDMLDIFRELYQHQYPIERMVLVDDYDANDDLSMAANNTSSFNYRNIDRSTQLSLHSYGLAVDINPLYNPYVREMNGATLILPEEGSIYADRSLDCPYFIRKNDICYEAFIKRGFKWGGDWVDSKDYQHFQIKK